MDNLDLLTINFEAKIEFISASSNCSKYLIIYNNNNLLFSYAIFWLYFRQGIELAPKERRVHCYSAECTDFSPPFFTLQVRCGGGFYVRSLVHDIGLGKILIYSFVKRSKPCQAFINIYNFHCTF